jgi:hypothetical protein
MVARFYPGASFIGKPAKPGAVVISLDFLQSFKGVFTAWFTGKPAAAHLYLRCYREQNPVSQGAAVAIKPNQPLATKTAL